MISSLAATLAPQPSVTRFRYTMGVLPMRRLQAGRGQRSVHGAPPLGQARLHSSASTSGKAHLTSAAMLAAVACCGAATA